MTDQELSAVIGGASEETDGPIEAAASVSADPAHLLELLDTYSLFLAASRSLFKRYDAAIRQARTRIEILDADLESRFKRNPIHDIATRLKSPKSTYEKMVRRGYPLTLESLEKNVLDVAGVRVVVSYIDDVYVLLKVLLAQDDLELVKLKDYIANPKPNGYRSLHVVVKVPVYFLDRKQMVPVEIQIRTIAMDFWASLEHTLKYKGAAEVESIDMVGELKHCATMIEDVEQRMQIMMHAVRSTEEAELAKRRRGDILSGSIESHTAEEE
jgi:putative GTP pyrophosphokinase